MKQYLNSEQTARLIELGLPKPKSMNGEHNGWQFMPTPAYSIGELIEMLGYDLYSIRYSGISWEVKGEQVVVTNKELVDALYDMIVLLKEEGVI